MKLNFFKIIIELFENKEKQKKLLKNKNLQLSSEQLFKLERLKLWFNFIKFMVIVTVSMNLNRIESTEIINLFTTLL